MLLGSASLPAYAQKAAQTPSQAQAQAQTRRFMAELSAFAPKDGTKVQEGGTLFIGSSSIRLWDLTSAFPKAQAVNHGFGGATVRDVLASYDLLVAGQEPANILVYVGENDLAEGRKADEVAGDLSALMTRLRKDFPKARIAYLSMKVAPSRWSLRRAVGSVNRDLRKQAGDGFDYLDVAGGLRAGDALPDSALYGRDGLHLSALGYERWNEVVGKYLLPEAPAEIIVPPPVLPVTGK